MVERPPEQANSRWRNYLRGMLVKGRRLIETDRTFNSGQNGSEGEERCRNGGVWPREWEFAVSLSASCSVPPTAVFPPPPPPRVAAQHSLDWLGGARPTAFLWVLMLAAICLFLAVAGPTLLPPTPAGFPGSSP